MGQSHHGSFKTIIATGKTTLAELLSKIQERPFYQISAINAGVKDIREIIEKLQINKMSLKDLDQSIADYTTFEIGECVRLLLENNDVILTSDNKLKINQ